MSNFVNVAVLSPSIPTMEIQKWLKKKKKNCFYKENIAHLLIAFKDPSEKIFMELSTVCVFLIHLTHDEDTGWGMKLFQEGKQVGGFEVNYNRKKATEASLLSLSEIFRRVHVQGDELLALLSSNRFKEIEGNSWEALLELLGVEVEDSFYYDMIDRQSDSYKVMNKLTHFQFDKTLPVKKIILEVLGPAMKEKGYEYSTDTELPYDYAFLRKIEGIEVGLGIYLGKYSTGQEITGYFITLFEKVPVNINPLGIFKTKEELVSLLKRISKEFNRMEMSLLNDLNYEPFDKSSVYFDLVDPFLAKYSMERVETVSSTGSGYKITYAGNRKEILFEEFQSGIGLHVSIRVPTRFNLIRLHDFKQYQGRYKYKFHNQIEFIEVLTQYLSILEEDYLQDKKFDFYKVRFITD